LKLSKPNKSEALYGFLGGLFVAVVAAIISLIPWVWPNIDADDRLRDSVESGFAQFTTEKDLQRQLEYLDQIDRDLKRSWAVHRMGVSRDYRSEVETELEQRRLAEVARREAIAAEQERLEEIRLAELAATEAEEEAKLEAERQAVLEAERQRLAEEQRLLEEQRQREAELERQRVAEEKRLAEQRRAAALEAERQWQSERFCRNESCTSWILR
jgi:hypothetical protein